jgi:hypothetical protein
MTSFPDDERPNFANESYCRPQCSFFSSDGVKVAMGDLPNVRGTERVGYRQRGGSVVASGTIKPPGCCIEHSHIY